MSNIDSIQQQINSLSKDGGIGIKLSGYPTNEKKFTWILAQEGCHPNATQRILDRMKPIGYDLLTVMDRLNFYWLISQLKGIEVTLTIIKPSEHYILKDEGKWPKEYLPDFKNWTIGKTKPLYKP